jgi:hypothetical protein
MYYDLQKLVVLQTDASEVALGGALMQPNKDGKLQPVAFTSCNVSATEQRYSQIEKECLVMCNCFQKFDKWLKMAMNKQIFKCIQTISLLKLLRRNHSIRHQLDCRKC